MNITKVVGGVQIGISCQVKRAEEKRKAKREKVAESASMLFGNEKKRAEKRAQSDILSTRWKEVRKAASMEQIL